MTLKLIFLFANFENLYCSYSNIPKTFLYSSDRFPYYKSNDDRWKNSVRHNLSINPHFRKGHKAPQGAGHLWTISSGDSAENVLAWEHVSFYAKTDPYPYIKYINLIYLIEKTTFRFILQNGIHQS